MITETGLAVTRCQETCTCVDAARRQLCRMGIAEAVEQLVEAHWVSRVAAVAAAVQVGVVCRAVITMRAWIVTWTMSGVRHRLHVLELLLLTSRSLLFTRLYRSDL